MASADASGGSAPLRRLLAAALLVAPALGIKLGNKLPVEEPKRYFWPSGRGPVGSYSSSPFRQGFNVTAPTWSWHHPAGLWGTIPIGTTIDDQRNIYLSAQDGLRKFTPDGRLLWTYTRREEGEYQWEILTKVCALMQGAAYGISTKGRAFAVDMDSGRELWSLRVSNKGSDGNYGHVVADDGVVIVAAGVSPATNRLTPSCCGQMNHKIVGIDGAAGKVMWEYQPSIPIWNFGASFLGDGTFIYQDLEGRVHRNRASDGSLVWKSGGVPESWTDGQANAGPNGLVYGVSNYGIMGPEGRVSAYNASTGALVWSADVDRCPNSIPAVARLAGREGFSVVLPIGDNDKAGARVDVQAWDAATGKPQWRFKGPTQTVSMGQGDAPELSRQTRSARHLGLMTMPNSWGTAAVDAAGTVFVGGTTGHFYALRDLNGDGAVAGPKEVSVMETPADWVGSAGVALAPGLLATANANSLFAWQS